MKSLTAGIGLLMMTVATPAFAAELDFRSSAFAGANGDPSFQYTASDGVVVTIKAGPAPLATLHQDSNDGFGVASIVGYEADEIEGYESLTISFSETVLITDVFLSDLFIEDPILGKSYQERGYYSLNGGPASQVLGVSTGNNGETTISPNALATSISFTAPGIAGVFGLQNHEFSVAGLNYTASGSRSVPELDPSAAGTALMLLIGSALLLGDRRRRTA